MSISQNEIRFRRIKTKCLGRNGWSKAIGLYLISHGLEIGISPINTKENVTRCEIIIPKEDIPDLINALKEMIE